MLRTVVDRRLVSFALLVVACCVGTGSDVAALEVEQDGTGFIVRFDPGDVIWNDTEHGTTVDLASHPGALRRPGAPSLPMLPVVVEIPVEMTAVGVSVTSDTRVVLSDVTLAPAPVPVPVGDRPAPLLPDAALFSDTYPAQRVQLTGEGFARDHRLVSLQVAPLQWNPHTRDVELATRVRFELDLMGSDSRPLERFRRVDSVENRYDRALAKAIGAPAPARLIEPQSAAAAPFVPSFPPSTDGSAVKYLIVTTDEMKLEFQLLANWRTQMGLQTVVRTIEWVEGFYPNGADRAEQLRFFLQDAYQNWGTLWVLLGGDSEVLPVRYASSTLQVPPDDPKLIPTDLYFACLDGNWNGDKDDRIGEGFLSVSDPGDSADLFPELYVGRIPVTTSQGASDYVAKLIDYERAPPVDENYPASMLFLAEDLGFDDGAEIAELAVAQVHPWMRVVRLYENFENFPGALPLDRDSAIDSVNSGFGWVHHVGHGFRNTMSVGEESIANPDADGLVNGSRQSFVFAINCSSASVDFNSIGERWVKNPMGGSVGYIGTTRLAFAQVSERYQNEFYRLAFADSVVSAGECLFMARVPWIGSSFGDNFDRWTQLALVLLGDPALPLWTHRPTSIQAVHDASMTLGDGTFSVKAENEVGDAIEGANVTLWQIAQDYKYGVTDALGEVSIPFDPETTDAFQTTITRRNFLPYQQAVDVDASGTPFLFIQGVTLNDDDVSPSNGNGDNVADAGETVELNIAIRNSGLSTATGITTALNVEDGAEYVTVLSSNINYPDMPPGAIEPSIHLVRFEPDAPDGFLPRFRIDVGTNEGVWTDIFVVPVYTIEIEQYDHDWLDPMPGGNDDGVIDAGETIAYNVELRNNGVGEAVAVTGTLRMLNINTGLPDPLVTMDDDTASYGDLLPAQRAIGGYGFTLDPGANPADLRLELSIDHSWGQTAIQLSDLDVPGPVDSLRAIGNDVSITVKWGPATAGDLFGYDIFRASVPEGPFTRVNGQTIVGTTFFENYPLDPLTRFYYQVAARDSSANQGPFSEVIAATTNPPVHLGWPIEVGQSTTSGPKCADLVPGGPLELIVGADCIYAWDGNGVELVDGDNDPRTSGVFTLEGCDALNGFRSDAAIADLNHDSQLEVIIAGWGTSANEGFLHVLEPDGTPRAGWPRSLDKPWNWGSAAVGQITPDSNLEIVAMQGQTGVLYAFDADGNELLDGDSNPATVGPFFASGSSFNYGSPALGDIDGDQLDEIVVVQNSTLGRIFVVDGDGTVMPGWPYQTNGKITSSPVIANVDGLGMTEIVVASQNDSVYVFNHDGTLFPGWPRWAEIDHPTARTPSPVVVDLDRNGVLDVILVANDGQIHVWDKDGTPLADWQSVFFAQTALESSVSEATPTVGDIDGDGEYEMLVGAEDGRLYGFNHDGTEVLGFPIQFEGEVRSAASIADIDGDGLVEIAVSGWDQNIYVWDLNAAFNPALTPWPFFRRDLLNRGNLEPPAIIGVSDAIPVAPAHYALGRARPNPFNPTTHIDLDVPVGSVNIPLSVRVYDVGGRLQRTLVDGPLEPGRHTIAWDGQSSAGVALPSGLYFMHAKAGDFEAVQKLMLLK